MQHCLSLRIYRGKSDSSRPPGGNAQMATFERYAFPVLAVIFLIASGVILSKARR